MVQILMPLAKIGSVSPVIMRDNVTERYIQIVSTDGHDFWFMGFVNFDKATDHLFNSISSYAAPGIPTIPAQQHAPDPNFDSSPQH